MSIKITARVFVPEEVLSVQEVRRRIERTMRNKSWLDVGGEFLKTVRTWKHNVGFDRKIISQSARITLQVYPIGANAWRYNLVNFGSPEHPISPRRGRLLRFQDSYAPKTRVGIIGSFVGGKYGPYTTRSFVTHPGFEAREFDKMIAEQYIDTFAEDIQDAIGLAYKTGREVTSRF
jgi:hypothetical protein